LIKSFPRNLGTLIYRKEIVSDSERKMNDLRMDVKAEIREHKVEVSEADLCKAAISKMHGREEYRDGGTYNTCTPRGHDLFQRTGPEV
jgi:hypothetical protein